VGIKKNLFKSNYELHPKSWTQDWMYSFFVSKLTREEKIEIFERRKKGETISSLQKLLIFVNLILNI